MEVNGRNEYFVTVRMLGTSDITQPRPLVSHPGATTGHFV